MYCVPPLLAVEYRNLHPQGRQPSVTAVTAAPLHVRGLSSANFCLFFILRSFVVYLAGGASPGPPGQLERTTYLLFPGINQQTRRHPRSWHSLLMKGISSLLVTSGPSTSATSFTLFSAFRRISWSEDSKSSCSNCRGEVPPNSSGKGEQGKNMFSQR